MNDKIKVVMKLGVELDDIPDILSDLLCSNTSRRMSRMAETIRSAADMLASDEPDYSRALEDIDGVRQNLAKIDMSLMDATSILAGYIKTKADINQGIVPTQQEETNDQVGTGDTGEPQS